MGLDTSHDYWSGGYVSYFRWRLALARAAGFKMREDPMFGEVWEPGPKGDVLNDLLQHSDCEGKISWKLCGPIATRLEALLPALAKLGDGGGRIGNYEEKTKQFIKGLRDAASKKENVEYF